MTAYSPKTWNEQIRHLSCDVSETFHQNIKPIIRNDNPCFFVITFFTDKDVQKEGREEKGGKNVSNMPQNFSKKM